MTLEFLGKDERVPNPFDVDCGCHRNGLFKFIQTDIRNTFGKDCKEALKGVVMWDGLALVVSESQLR
jgi:hypothetical protein